MSAMYIIDENTAIVFSSKKFVKILQEFPTYREFSRYMIANPDEWVKMKVTCKGTKVACKKKRIDIFKKKMFKNFEHCVQYMVDVYQEDTGLSLEEAISRIFMNVADNI